MIKKLWVTAASNTWVTISFVFITWALVDTYHLREWSWFILFVFFLPFYVHKLAKTSTVYDMMKRNGEI